jgi:hypothetical protein
MGRMVSMTGRIIRPRRAIRHWRVLRRRLQTSPRRPGEGEASETADRIPRLHVSVVGVLSVWKVSGGAEDPVPD